MGADWSREEVEATVADYFAMLHAELAGVHYVKAEHRRRLIGLLDGRSEGAIERKHMNISAVLRTVGHPFIDGYKPYGNYQALLEEVVLDRLDRNHDLRVLVENLALQPVKAPRVDDILSRWKPAPDLKEQEEAQEPLVGYALPEAGRERTARRVDYLAQETRNRSLGAEGERFVLRYEAERLHRAGKKRLADRVEQVSDTRGDGLGYDVLSFEESGEERFIEVKTTSFGQRTPFFVSRNEVAFSREEPERFHLYRVYAFRREPALYGIRGPLDAGFTLEPSQFRAFR
jgi:hypothetical protein